jgi:hypothetical protein
MTFHWPSFLLGYASGAGTVLLARHLRPLLIELASGAYQAADAVAARLAITREDFDDLLAEAKARARGKRQNAKSRLRGVSGTRTTARRKTARTLRAVPA